MVALWSLLASPDHREFTPPKGHAVHNQQLNYKVQPQCNHSRKFSLKMTQQGRNMYECPTSDEKTLCAFVGV
jgi:hypothetical protein